jgi:ferric-dicitrate binding protein FerR (iron transport regulator)
MQRPGNPIKAYLEGRLSKQELEELLANSPGHNSDLNAEVQELLESGIFDGMTDTDQRQQMYSRMMQRIATEKRKQRPLLYHPLAAAAAVLIIFAGFGGWWIFKQPKGLPAARPIARAMPASGKKVTLTLDDGTAIELDTTGKGILARQGNTVITGNGARKIAYNAPGVKTDAILYNKISTPKGETYQVTLPDGSSAMLNAASSVRFPVVFPKNSRTVEISGEVYFDVQKNTAPFLVKAGGTEIQVLSTRFNINSYTDEKSLKVTLLDGAVKVTSDKVAVTLKPGQQAIVAGGNTDVMKEIDLDEVMAWKNGNFAFNHQTLPEIMRQISRWYDMEVAYSGKVNDKRFTGIVSRNENITEVLKFMQMAGIKFQISERKITVIQ